MPMGLVVSFVWVEEYGETMWCLTLLTTPAGLKKRWQGRGTLKSQGPRFVARDEGARGPGVSGEGREMDVRSLASSTGDLSTEALQLERAIRANDTLRVKRFLDLHHDKFQVSAPGRAARRALVDTPCAEAAQITTQTLTQAVG
ncbi:Uncharacterized protein GBIM_02822 [Gryllus bimaculatus]|nr:Uncharacterized protein GBIM_02822 [Gryllus bimaculatus]